MPIAPTISSSLSSGTHRTDPHAPDLANRGSGTCSVALSAMADPCLIAASRDPEWGTFHVNGMNRIFAIALRQSFRRGVRAPRCKVEEVDVEANHSAEFPLAHDGSHLQHRLEYGSKFTRRMSDHAQDLGGRRLLPSASLSSPCAACTSSNSRAFSMAMTAWSAKVSTSSICLSVNARRRTRITTGSPIGRPLVKQTERLASASVPIFKAGNVLSPGILDRP